MARLPLRRLIDRLQLGLPFGDAQAATLPCAERIEATPPIEAAAGETADLRTLDVVRTPTPVSRTRALIDAIQTQIPGARVVLMDNRSVLLSQQRRNGQHVVRVHQMFLDAPPDVRAATAHFLARGDKTSGRVVDSFIDAQSHLLTMAARPLAPDAHIGRIHDLRLCYDAVNDRYFEGRISAEIGWGQGGRRSRRARTSITFGSYDHRAQRIVIHPVLDQPHVPGLVVARVVHHEMLHAKHGEERDRGGRRVVHGRAFRTEEARFDRSKDADAWLEAHMDSLLRFRRVAGPTATRRVKTR